MFLSAVRTRRICTLNWPSRISLSNCQYPFETYLQSCTDCSLSSLSSMTCLLSARLMAPGPGIPDSYHGKCTCPYSVSSPSSGLLLLSTQLRLLPHTLAHNRPLSFPSGSLRFPRHPACGRRQTVVWLVELSLRHVPASAWGYTCNGPPR